MSTGAIHKSLAESTIVEIANVFHAVGNKFRDQEEATHLTKTMLTSYAGFEHGVAIYPNYDKPAFAINNQTAFSVDSIGFGGGAFMMIQI